MNWNEILSVKILGDSAITIAFGPLILILLALWVIYLIFVKKIWKEFGGVRVEQADIKLGGLGNITVKPDYDDMQVAHKAWVELATRKVGLPFDEEHDVIVEIYDSWYTLFGEMRNLTKEIPARKVRRNKDTQKLVKLLIDALNKGLRPHLTQWQARFRRWYEKQVEKQTLKSPQEIQKLYPEYENLVKDLKKVNTEMVEYTEFIRKIAHGDDTITSVVKKIKGNN